MDRTVSEGRGYETPCLIWQGPKSKSTGYGLFYNTVDHQQITEHVHRVAWKRVHGPLPAGYHVHHRCGVRLCVNVDHLEALPAAEHSRLHAVHQARACGVWSPSLDDSAKERWLKRRQELRQQRVDQIVKVDDTR